ncbi:hypothetical protein BJX99DRAFT_225613 [Aspergillus californicus]
MIIPVSTGISTSQATYYLDVSLMDSGDVSPRVNLSLGEVQHLSLWPFRLALFCLITYGNCCYVAFLFM